MDRNIRLAYVLVYLKNSWFWLGTWVFYYLRFTDYAGIGLIETVMIITMTTCEIPTGAVADLLGKKNTLKVSFFLQTVGNIYMALAGDFFHLLVSVVIQSIGGTLYSGTLDALVYDSLKQSHHQIHFPKIISRISSIQLVAIVICGLVSGLLYGVNPSLPYLTSALFYFIGFLLCFPLIEPQVDTLKFSFSNFLLQTKVGFSHLFKNINITSLVFLLLSVGGILTIADEMGESILSYEYGITSNQIGIFFAFIFLVAAFISPYTPKISRRFNQIKLLVILSVFIALSFTTSPFVGLILGSVVLVIRQSLATVFNNLSSIVINENTDSSNRATTISSFNMLKNLPYVIGAVYIGRMMDLYSAKIVYFYLGLLILAFILIQLPNFIARRNISSFN